MVVFSVILGAEGGAINMAVLLSCTGDNSITVRDSVIGGWGVFYPISLQWI
jgi:hypothetical protein